MIASCAASKAKLRDELKKKIASMVSPEQQRQSTIVQNMVMQTPQYKGCKNLCLYLSMQNEVSTMAIMQDALRQGKICFVPRYTKDDMEMLRLYSYDDYLGLAETKWRIKQPESSENREEALATGRIDLMLVPGLGFTSSGLRLGRGKGYYDKYLTKCLKLSSPPHLMGLAFKEQIVDHIPVSNHDLPVHTVIFPRDDVL